MSTPSPLVLDDLDLSYGTHEVARDLSLTLSSGETFGLIGLNGAGKTTLLKTILGLRLIEKGEGQAHLFGLPPAVKENRDKLAYLPERFEPPSFLSGAEFLRFSLFLYNQKPGRSELMEAAQSLALDPAALDKRVSSYSKGMRQKLGLLSTILTPCPLLVLDEPMSGLDPLARALLKAQLKNLKAQGRTILLSSHILADMDVLCDRVGILHDGQLSFIGSASDLKAETKENTLEEAFLKHIGQ